MRPWVEGALRLALYAFGAWLGWRLLGAVGLAVTAPLAGVLLARPLMDLASGSWQASRARAYREVEGRHYAYRGQPVGVLEDVAHRRHVRTADVHLAVGRSPHGAAMGEPPQPHVEAEALLAWLSALPDERALRFRRWVERDVAFPARERRKRLGIRDAVAPAASGREQRPDLPQPEATQQGGRDAADAPERGR